jgi:hypothetical protein
MSDGAKAEKALLAEIARQYPTPATTAVLLDEIRNELQSEVYGGKLNWGEVGVVNFIFWCHNYQQHNLDRLKHRITDFDMESAMTMFEEWVIGGKIK